MRDARDRGSRGGCLARYSRFRPNLDLRSAYRLTRTGHPASRGAVDSTVGPVPKIGVKPGSYLAISCALLRVEANLASHLVSPELS